MLPALHRSAPLGAVRGVTVALLAVGTAAHLGWLAEFVLDTGLSPLWSFPSGLSAEGQPYHQVFRGAEWVAGAAFVLASPPLLRLAPVHWQGRTTVAMVCLFGALLLLHAAFPADCAVTVTGACRAREEFSTAHQVNRAVSLALNVHYIAGPAILALWWQGRWRAVAWGVFVVELVAWCSIVLGSLFWPWQFVGLAARVRLVALSLLLGVGIVYLTTVGRKIRDREGEPWRRG